jgi:enamine deaminase RidA (YjgF/YER057c/UK114 family)
MMGALVQGVNARLPEGVSAKLFRGAGGTLECHLVVEAPAGPGFDGQLLALEALYDQALGVLGLAPHTAVFRRLFLSDLLNQATSVRRSALVTDEATAVSIIQQPPLSGAKVAMLAYHVDAGRPLPRRRLSTNHLLVEHGGLGHLWSTRLCAGIEQPGSDAAAQTRAVFERLVAALEQSGGTLLDNCVRTWLFMRDVDLFYHDMVAARSELFERFGLTADTHTISSTGIEGACSHQFDLVSMDAYSVVGMLPEQMSFLNDFELLCPTRDYNVTFERGTRIAYADRAHHFISGTASIDNLGRVVHEGDVLAQLDRALVNVDGLLKSGGAGLADMQHLIVYLRDAADYAPVRARLAQCLPDLPTVVVEGAVCRPGWLIEIEGIAAAADSRPDLPRF